MVIPGAFLLAQCSATLLEAEFHDPVSLFGISSFRKGEKKSPRKRLGVNDRIGRELIRFSKSNVGVDLTCLSKRIRHSDQKIFPGRR